MRKFLFTSVILAAALFAFPSQSFAQRGGGHGGGGHGGGGHGDGGGGNWHGGGGGYYGHGGYYGRGYYGGGFGLYLGGYPYYGYGYGSPYYYGAPYYGGYYYGAPYTYVEPSPAYVQPSLTTAAPSYAQIEPAGDPNSVMLEVRVPDNAEIWVNGDKTSQTGAVRHFASPPVATGQKFVYELRARWTDGNGKVVDKTKKLDVHAGARLGVDFNTL
jgi:uncharacterized protein (TIGR03000 family)